ncbi:MAG: divergent polysaccharide deacetylase family protein [Parvibaculaceae bacterium]|nr:divergent polysaccharide deacetylase family protein [Kangiella sp.]
MRQSDGNSGAGPDPAGTPGYVGAIGAALALGAAFGLAWGLIVPSNGSAPDPAALVAEVVPPAGPAVSAMEKAPGRPAPTLLGPNGARPVPGTNPFAFHDPRRRTADPGDARSVAGARPAADSLDMPMAETVTALRTRTPILEPAGSVASPLVEPVAVETEGPRPRIALVLDDLGLDEKATRRAISLPSAVTLSFLPYGGASAGLAEEAMARGHEIMAHIPMEPDGDADPGPNALWADQSADGIASRLASQLDRFPGAVGFNNHMGSRFTADVRALLPVMREARARGLLFLDSRTTANTLAAKVAQAAGATAVSRDVFLDHEQGPDGFLAQLSELEKTAMMTGSAIGIAHPHDLSLDILDVWTRGLAAKGYDLVPITEMTQPDGAADKGLLAASGL